MKEIKGSSYNSKYHNTNLLLKLMIKCSPTMELGYLDSFS